MARQKFKDLVASKKTQNTGGGNSENSNFFAIEEVRFDSSKADDKKNIVLPVDEDGEVILWEQPFHRLVVTNKTPNGRGLIELPKRAGGVYTPYEFGCTHFVTERDPDVREQLKADKHVCILCDIKNHENRKIWSVINETYPEFNTKTGKEKNEIFTKVASEVRTVEEAWEFVKDEDGSNELRINKHNKVLVAELADDGSFELKIWKLSDSRLKKLNQVLAESVDAGVFPEENTSVLSDVDGEIVYDIGQIQFLIKYPKNDNKAQAGRDASFQVVGPAKSQIIKDDSLREKINEEARAIIDKVEGVIERDYNLKPRTEEEVLELLDVEYYNSLKEEYPAKPFNKEGEGDKKSAKKTTKKASKKAEKVEEKVDESEDTESVDDLFN